MGPELEPKPKSEAAMEVSVVKETGDIRIDPEEKFMPCVSNYKDNIFDMEASFAEQTTTSNRIENEELNMTECASPNDVQMVENECRDVTESSSSFGNTISGTDNGSMLDGDEVESRFCENPSVSLYDGYSDAFQTRKKKLTVHWRKFIRPLMWRCKWLELQIKELQSQTLKYDAELAECDKLKQFEFGSDTTVGSDAKSIPFSSQIQRNKFMKRKKRKKRKRVEDTSDIALYTSNHKLFSYYENKRSAVNGASIEDDCGNLASGKTSHGINEFEIEFRDGDSTLEDTLRKIEVVHSQVCQLKTRIDKVVKENPALFGCPQIPTPENENELLAETIPTAFQHISDCNMGPLLLPGSAVSSDGLTPLPGKIGNTDQPWVGTAHENAEDGYLIPNSAVKKEPHDFENNKDQFIQTPHLLSADQKINISVTASKTVPAKSSLPNRTQQPDSTTRTDFPWNTRNRGKHKVGSYRWSRKS